MNKNTIYSLFAIGITCFVFQCKTKANEDILIPVQNNAFVEIYKPSGDYFFGPDTPRLKEGEWYDKWIPNDHTFVKDTLGYWHIFGITHPYVPTQPIHEGEFASFHAIASEKGFKNSTKQHHYKDLPKVLPPSDRPGEINANHAPYIVKKDGIYHMIYGHSPIRLATSTNLKTWQPQGNLFEEAKGARDPNLLFFKDKYYIIYCSEKCVMMRTSDDLKHWSDAKIILKTENFDPESPSLIYHNNTFYLFVCAWVGPWGGKELQGAYTHETHVYASKDIENFGTNNEKEITVLNAHAPEIFQDEEGQWYISSVVWPNIGVSVDKLTWKTIE